MYHNINQWLQSNNPFYDVHPDNFNTIALDLFHYQYQHNRIYQNYVQAIHCNPKDVTNILKIPFLPILFFKTHTVKTHSFDAEVIFESSGTTTTINSQHHIKDLNLYEQSFLINFEKIYGNPSQYVFLCLLPSYLERNNSSLVYMAQELIKKSQYSESDFYLHDFQRLSKNILQLQQQKRKIILLGVTFALLDFAEEYPMDLNDVIVMETGGMKGRREEWSKPQIHDFLKKQWNLPTVHSEYGMTELLSQAYSKGEGIFQPSATLKVLTRSQNDPFDIDEFGTGALNIIDLANIHSCSFIATDDLAKIHSDHTFEILGRLDHSALRGCSLMAL